jgi:hypothetical protein
MTLRLNINLDPNYVTGIIDGEGCFYVTFQKHSECVTGWNVRAGFTIGMHQRDLALLEQIKAHFGVGNVYLQSKKAYQYRVTSIKDLINVIIPHFIKYPLITQKRADFELFRQIVCLINHKKHVTLEGLLQIISIKAAMNSGLSDTLKAAFPNINPVSRPLVSFSGIPSPYWLAGFVDAEGCFMIRSLKSSTHKLGVCIRLTFTVNQHSRDNRLIEGLVGYLGCGSYYPSLSLNQVEFRVSKNSEINKILLFFDKYAIQGAKSADYADFKRAAELMKEKAHLTELGIKELLLIKAGMNKGRAQDSSE